MKHPFLFKVALFAHGHTALHLLNKYKLYYLAKDAHSTLISNYGMDPTTPHANYVYM